MMKSRKALLSGVVAAAGAGYIAGKKRYEDKSAYSKVLHKLDNLLH